MQTKQRNRRRFITALAVIGTAGLTLSACGDSKTADSTATSGGLEAGQTYKIGYATAATGRLAVFDEPYLKGLQAQVAAINQAGGIDGKVKIVLDVQDAKSDPATGATVAQDLIDNGAQFLITACDADASLPAAQVAQKAQVPTMSSCGSGASLPSQVGNFSFLTVYGTKAMGDAMGEFAASQGWKNAGLMRSTAIEYTDSIPTAAQASFEANGGKIAKEVNYTLDQPNYTTIATELAGSGMNVLLTPIFLTGSVTLLKNLRAAGFSGPVVTADGQEGSETFSAGTAANDLYVSTYGSTDDAQGASLRKFNELYKTKYGEYPGTVLAALGADDAIVIAAAVTAADSTDGVKVRDSLDQLKDVQGATSKITYQGGKGLPSRDVVILKSNVPKKRFDFVKRFRPASLQQAG